MTSVKRKLELSVRTANRNYNVFISFHFKSIFCNNCFLSFFSNILLSIRLVVQRTKLIDDAQDILLALLEELTTG